MANRRLVAPESFREAARELGFPLLGAVEAGESEFFREFQTWVDSGKCAGMTYLREHLEARRHPGSVLPGVRSILMLAMPFTEFTKIVRREYSNHPIQRYLASPDIENSISEPSENTAFVARYAAAGVDYHDVIRRRLKILQKTLQEIFPNQKSRGIVDTAPFFEREFAFRAGLGFPGRNRMLIHPDYGSLFFIAAILTTEPLPAADGPPPEPLLTPEKQREFRKRCDSCGRCLRACPTGALTDGGLDARLCVSYRTVEERGSGDGSPAPTRYLLGCDECQKACPWNCPFPQPALFRLDMLPVPEETLRHTPFYRPGAEKLETRAEELRKMSADASCLNDSDWKDR